MITHSILPCKLKKIKIIKTKKIPLKKSIINRFEISPNIIKINKKSKKAFASKTKVDFKPIISQRKSISL